MSGRPSPDAVVVLLSSFNGARFISEQIESIRRQSFGAWTLLIRDDGSTDETIAVLEGLARQDPRIRLTHDGGGNLGAAASFGVLLELAAENGAGYVAFADQDDVWHPDKLERQLAVLQRREGETGPQTPLLVHSDLTVVAEDLRVIHPSFLEYQHLRHVTERPLASALVQNFVTGCTAVFNRALVLSAVPLPRVVMHDWWMALCAASMGEILYLPAATVLYRQHDTNAIGSRGWARVCGEALRRPQAWWRESGARFAAAVQQACELGRRLPAGPEALRDFSQAFERDVGALRRLQVLRRHGIRPRTLLPVPVFFYFRALLWSPAPPARIRTGARRPAIFNPKDGHA